MFFLWLKTVIYTRMVIMHNRFRRKIVAFSPSFSKKSRVSVLKIYSFLFLRFGKFVILPNIFWMKFVKQSYFFLFSLLNFIFLSVIIGRNIRQFHVLCFYVCFLYIKSLLLCSFLPKPNNNIVTGGYNRES